MTVAEYVRRRNALKYTTFRITPEGKAFFIVDGVPIPEREFLKRNELPVSLVLNNKENSDKTKLWLQ